MFYIFWVLLRPSAQVTYYRVLLSPSLQAPSGVGRCFLSPLMTTVQESLLKKKNKKPSTLVTRFYFPSIATSLQQALYVQQARAAHLTLVKSQTGEIENKDFLALYSRKKIIQ